VPGDPAADFSSVKPATVIETAVLVAAAGRVVFGLGVTQQQQTAHVAIPIRFQVCGLMYKQTLAHDPPKCERFDEKIVRSFHSSVRNRVTSARWVRKKTI
jgi:hypothetical protein